MDVSDAIITVVKVAGDNILGRTAIQKIVYFLSISGIVDIKYRPHYYGRRAYAYAYNSEVC